MNLCLLFFAVLHKYTQRSLCVLKRVTSVSSSAFLLFHSCALLLSVCSSALRMIRMLLL
ncbi:hypothetical protein PICMEDRAFT_14551 [Pichia membranifaciens NRRL Y-2026]|uniref:Uncharacterized protein n=1 Tax=Pichia membranifaciens NRRL Y-2026 TaxID=763406 RepID=A0A1E3NSF6_9ASCO|nr:hypothetical protein PICMEDRAFT_14551 [Pichia membranifaciens NRRL Y-2026]ODQ49065.1 hypothetical protein PICMEDRAFT_14551 [Pichia membranifaciens NRRL Y-2026]